MRRLTFALRRSAQVALVVLAVGPAYAVYLGMGGQGGPALMERAAPLIRLSFWCAMGVFLVVLVLGLLHPVPSRADGAARPDAGTR